MSSSIGQPDRPTPTAIPERVWLHGFDTYQGFSTANLGEYCYVPEQRALDAERERDAYRTVAETADESWTALRTERDALRADLRALAPLAKYALPLWEDCGPNERLRAILAAYDQARGPTVPTRTASGYSNQAAPDE